MFNILLLELIKMATAARGGAIYITQSKNLNTFYSG